jgi:heme exporter protein C
LSGIWWKILAVLLVSYAIVGGMLLDVPELPILNESIRNLYYHVTMWFSMMLLLLVSFIGSIRFLLTGQSKFDRIALHSAYVGISLGILGILTGSLWAKFTWGAFWVSDPKLNGAAVTLLIYIAYLILRNSIEDESKRPRISAVYNIFSFVLLIVFLVILPRTTDSLHPGNGGNPAFSTYDLDSTMRMVFYPAIIGWTLFGWWMVQLSMRLSVLNEKYEDNDI